MSFMCQDIDEAFDLGTEDDLLAVVQSVKRGLPRSTSITVSQGASSLMRDIRCPSLASLP